MCPHFICIFILLVLLESPAIRVKKTHLAAASVVGAGFGFFNVAGKKDIKEKAESVKVRNQGNSPEGYNTTSHLIQ